MADSAAEGADATAAAAGSAAVERTASITPHAAVAAAAAPTPTIPLMQMGRSVSAPGGAIHSDSDDDELPPPPPPPAAAAADAEAGDTVAASAVAPEVPLEEPQTPNESNTATAAAELLGPVAAPGSFVALGGVPERRGSRPNLRLQSQAPPKLTSTTTLAAPASSSLPPASPMTPAGFGVPPNTPLSSFLPPPGGGTDAPPMSPLMGGGGVALSGVGEGCPSPLCDEPFTPLSVPMSPMLPQPPPPSPFPQPLPSPARRVSDVADGFTTGRVASVVAKFNSPTNASGTTITMSPLSSPSASPHPPRQILSLPSLMAGIDVLSPKAAPAVAAAQPTPLQLSPTLVDQQRPEPQEQAASASAPIEEQEADLPPPPPQAPEADSDADVKPDAAAAEVALQAEPEAESEAELPPAPQVPAVEPAPLLQQPQDAEPDLPPPPQPPSSAPAQEDEDPEHFRPPQYDSDSDDNEDADLPPPPPPPAEAPLPDPEPEPIAAATPPPPPQPSQQQPPLPLPAAPLSPAHAAASAPLSPPPVPDSEPPAPYSPLPPPVPLVGLDAAHAAEEDESLDSMPSPRDGTNTLEVQVAHVVTPEAAPVKEAPLLLHRSRLGRLSIIHRNDLPTGVLPGSATSPPQASSSASSGPSPASASSSSSAAPLSRHHPSASAPPTAIDIARVSEHEVAQHSLKHGAVVTSVKRVQHVTFNPNDEKGAAALASIPDEWREALKKQFGLPANLQASVALPLYRSRIPLVLVRMHQFLVANKAFQTVGIFRLAPDSAECARLKAAINADVTAIERARSGDYTDPSACVSNLIKVWLRELPVALFHAIPGAQLATIGSHTPADELERIIAAHLKEPQQSIFRWLLDLCCDVTLHSDVNKMTAKNVAICIGPNLYSPPNVAGLGPQEAMKIIQQCKSYTNFLELCIGMREAQRGQPKTSAP